MTLKKILASAVVLAAVFAGAHSASAATAEELQAQITALMEQIAKLQGGSSSSSSAGCYAFTRDLSNGSQGADVTALQDYLKSTGHFPVTTGSTGYFGPVTAQAAAAWQSANGVAPAAGYFGALSRAKYNSLCGSTGSTGGSTGSTGGSTGLGGGEADLSDFNGSSGDDNDIEEGSNGDVYEFEFDVEDGDVNVERVDLMFKSTGADGDTKPWKVFDDITLMLNGEELDSVDGGDEDNWDEDAADEYRIRFTGLDGMVDEDDKAEFVVNVEAQSSVDDSDADVSWTIWVPEEGVRAIDGEGIDHTIGDADELGDAGESEEFDINEEGDSEDLTIKSTSADPDASTLLVEDDDTSDWYDVFIFSIEGEGGDIDLEELVLSVVTDSADYADVVNDIMIEIDGEAFDDYDFTGVDEDATTTTEVTFDLDGDFTVDEDDTVEVVVMMEFKSTDDGVNYTSGTTTVQVSTVSVEGEGADTITDVRTVNGEEHTLAESVAVISDVDYDVSKSEDDATGYINFTFTVEAEEGDVEFDVADNDVVDGSTDGVRFSILGVGVGTTTLVLIDGDASYGAGTWTINEGDEATFGLDTTLTGAGTSRVKLESVAGQTVDVTSTSVNLQ